MRSNNRMIKFYDADGNPLLIAYFEDLDFSLYNNKFELVAKGKRKGIVSNLIYSLFQFSLGRYDISIYNKESLQNSIGLNHLFAVLNLNSNVVFTRGLNCPCNQKLLQGEIQKDELQSFIHSRISID